MKIETKRLTIKPLNETEIRKYILEDFSLETVLKLEHKPRIITERVKKNIVTKILPNLIDETKNSLYYTFWTVISKEKNTIVADICFKGEPNENGEIEIGYGTYEDYRGNGYMTEAIEGLINWAFNQEDIKSILAETDPKNIASIRILEKNKFNKEKVAQENINWRLTKKHKWNITNR